MSGLGRRPEPMIPDGGSGNCDVCMAASGCDLRRCVGQTGARCQARARNAKSSASPTNTEAPTQWLCRNARK